MPRRTNLKVNKKSDSEPKKKGRRGWTTDDQENFLAAQIPSYRHSQSSNTRSDFWPPLWEKYFQQWPIQPASEKDNSADEQTEDASTEAAKLAKMKQVRIP